VFSAGAANSGESQAYGRKLVLTFYMVKKNGMDFLTGQSLICSYWIK
jgi:hypothetical protein